MQGFEGRVKSFWLVPTRAEHSWFSILIPTEIRSCPSILWVKTFWLEKSQRRYNLSLHSVVWAEFPTHTEKNTVWYRDPAGAALLCSHWPSSLWYGDPAPHVLGNPDSRINVNRGGMEGSDSIWSPVINIPILFLINCAAQSQYQILSCRKLDPKININLKSS